MTERRLLGELFAPEPAQWGLRGDPHLWRAMRVHFARVPMPSSLSALDQQLEAAFQLLAGVPLSVTESFRVEAFAHGGMSSGGISPVFWRERAVPLLKSRYANR